MTNPFRLGFLTHVRGSADPKRVYQETLKLFEAADQLGYDVGWVAQHHFNGTAGLLPSPFPFLAAVAERSRRLRLGIAIVVLPYRAIHMLEQIATQVAPRLGWQPFSS